MCILLYYILSDSSECYTLCQSFLTNHLYSVFYIITLKVILLYVILYARELQRVVHLCIILWSHVHSYTFMLRRDWLRGGMRDGNSSSSHWCWQWCAVSSIALLAFVLLHHFHMFHIIHFITGLIKTKNNTIYTADFTARNKLVLE